MDKRELKEEIYAASMVNHSNLLHYTKEGMSWRNDNIVINKGKLFDLIDQLEEPREFDRVLLKHINDVYDQYGYDYLPGFINDIKDGLAKLKESEKPVVPDFVGEWYEKESRDLNRAIYHLCNDTARMHHTAFDDFKKWFVHPANNSIETLIKMQNGYTVEEKKYYVIEPTTGQFLIKDNQQSKGVKWVDGFSSNPESYTEQEIKDYDERYVPFMVPVKEVDNE